MFYSIKLVFTAMLLLLVDVPMMRAVSDESVRDLRAIQTLAPLVKSVIRSVVSIKASVRTMEEYPVIESQSGFPDGPLPATRNVYGAGVIVDADRGLIITSNHAVKGADTILVMLSDQRKFDARIIQIDGEADLVVLRIDASGLIASPIGKPDEVEPGDFVVVISDPLGLDRSATFGIVSALHRSWPGIAYRDLIQTDALLDRGSSGGPIFNLRGEVVGVVAARIGKTVNERSFGFAIPADAMRRILLKSRR